MPASEVKMYDEKARIDEVAAPILLLTLTADEIEKAIKPNINVNIKR